MVFVFHPRQEVHRHVAVNHPGDPVLGQQRVGGVEHQLAQIIGVAGVAIDAVSNQPGLLAILEHPVTLTIGGNHQHHAECVDGDGGKQHGAAGFYKAGDHQPRREPVPADQENIEIDRPQQAEFLVELMVAETKIFDQPAVAVNAVQAEVDPGRGAEVVVVLHHPVNDKQGDDLVEIHRPGHANARRAGGFPDGEIGKGEKKPRPAGDRLALFHEAFLFLLLLCQTIVVGGAILEMLLGDAFTVYW